MVSTGMLAVEDFTVTPLQSMQETVEPPSETRHAQRRRYAMDKTRSLANPQGQYRTRMEEAGFATITRSDPEGDVLVASKLG
jgi:hypothetical protein